MHENENSYKKAVLFGGKRDQEVQKSLFKVTKLYTNLNRNWEKKRKKGDKIVV